MAVSEEEIDRRQKVLAEMRQRAVQLIKEIEEQEQQRLADAIHASIAEAGDPVSVDEAIVMLHSFFETGDVPTRSSLKS